MSLTETTVQGTLKPDGTLDLDQPVPLSPGRVQVIVQTLPTATTSQRGLANVIDEIRQSQQARGFKGRSAQEIETQRHEGEDDYEKSVQALWPQAQSGPITGGS